MRWETLQHYADCPGSWSVRLRQNFDSQVVFVEVWCWDCEQRHIFDPADPAVDENPPAAKRLSWSFYGSTLARDGLLAALPPTPAGRDLLLHPDAAIADSEICVYEWLVTDRAGNVLGRVGKLYTDSGREQYQWGTAGDAAGHGSRYQSPEAAAKALGKAVRSTTAGAAA